jgi:hypothetical protein
MAWNKGMKKTALSGFFHCQVQRVKAAGKSGKQP